MINVKVGEKVSQNYSDRILVITEINEDLKHLVFDNGMCIDFMYFGSDYEQLKLKNKSHVMKKAWYVAKIFASKFGGSAYQYMSTALRDAWASSSTDRTCQTLRGRWVTPSSLTRGERILS